MVYTVWKRSHLNDLGDVLMPVTTDAIAELLSALAALVAAIERVVALVLALASA